MLIRSDLPKVAERYQTTPEQSKAVVDGSIAYYGTYHVDEATKTVKLSVEGSTFAKYNGTDQPRNIKSVTADEMIVINRATSNAGVTAETVWRRSK